MKQLLVSKQDNHRCLLTGYGEKVCSCSCEMSAILLLSSEVGSSWPMGEWNLSSSVA